MVGRYGGEFGLSNVFEIIARNKENGVASVLVTTVNIEGSSPSKIGGKMLVTNEVKPIGTIGGGALEVLAIQEAKVCLEKEKSYVKTYDLSNESDENIKTGMICGGNTTLFFDYIPSKVPLYIFGAGHCSQAIVDRLGNLGYSANVIDNRDDVLNDFKGADRKIKTNYIEMEELEYLNESSFVIVATPSHKYDYEVLKNILKYKINPKYVGILGSEKKVIKFKENILRDVGKVTFSNMYMPCGIDIGGRTPEDIAISIIAEMQGIRYHKEGLVHLNKL
jgi:xanthine dehydrogenase accessory factor